MNANPQAVSVALIAQAVIDRKVKFGELDAVDFNSHLIPGDTKSYKEQTYQKACQEAWTLVLWAEKTRPR